MQISKWKLICKHPSENWDAEKVNSSASVGVARAALSIAQRHKLLEGLNKYFSFRERLLHWTSRKDGKIWNILKPANSECMWELKCWKGWSMSKSLSILEPGANLCPSGSPWMDAVSVYKTLFLVVKIDLARRWLLTSQEIVRSTVQQICVGYFLQPTLKLVPNVNLFVTDSDNPNC